MFDELPSIFLVGPMGAGKTTIGKLLAKQMQREFVDSDWYIEAQTGADIPWIFAKEGEAGFRDRETKAIDELTQKTAVILATGGGAVMREENREMLSSRGVVVYLNATVDVQMARTAKDKSRPLLQQPNPRKVLADLYQQRHPLYLDTADIVMTTGHTYPKQMVSELLAQIVSYGEQKQNQTDAENQSLADSASSKDL